MYTSLRSSLNISLYTELDWHLLSLHWKQSEELILSILHFVHTLRFKYLSFSFFLWKTHNNKLRTKEIRTESASPSWTGHCDWLVNTLQSVESVNSLSSASRLQLFWWSVPGFIFHSGFGRGWAGPLEGSTVDVLLWIGNDTKCM